MRITALVSLVTIFGLIFMACPPVCAEGEEGGIVAPGEFEILSGSYVSLAMDDLRAQDDRVQKADQYLADLGFQPSQEDTTDNFFGIKQTYSGQPEGIDSEQTYELYLQEYSNPDSEMAAAIGRVALKDSSGTYTNTYTFILEAPKADVSLIQEYYVGGSPGKLEIVEANSWWTCIVDQLSEIGAECGSSFNNCSRETTSLVGYIGCIAANCGTALSNASVCCNCGCERWCRWAYGCCRM
jgi:hypothetical protein